MKLYTGHLPGGELLLTVHDDDTHEVAFRTDQWETWGAPVKLTAVVP